MTSDAIDRRQRRVAAAVLGGVILMLLALSGRLVHINTTLRPRLLSHAKRQYAGNAVLPARRGRIFDSRGRVLATSRRLWDVFIDPVRAENLEKSVHALAPRVNLSPEDIEDMIRRRPNSRFIVVASTVDDVTADAVRDLQDPAVGLSGKLVRHYPLGTSMCHVLGYVGSEGHGLDGIELNLNKHLAGRDGRRATIRDARRRALWRSEDASTPPVDGGHLVLTIDAEIQRITETALDQAVRSFEAKSGLAVVMTPKTGDVLAMATIPYFDPNVAGESSADARRNRVLTDPIEPGSTIKPFIASGALAGGFVTTTEQIDCHMGRHYFGRRLIKDVTPQGLTDLRGIIVKSSNIGMTQIGMRMGKDVLYETIRGFGFGARTGIECPGENAGSIRPASAWSEMTTQSVSFGYEIGVTPFQLITAYAALINDGTLLKPRLVRGLLGSGGDVLEWHEGPEAVRRSTPVDVARYIRDELLVAVVNEGRSASVMPARYRVLGKTGTSKLTLPGHRGYVDGAYQSTFVGAAPASDPQVLVLIMIRRPNMAIGYYGATVAAPAAGRIIAQSLAYLEVPPDRPMEIAGL
ncbi:MAG: penicillin-binding protein 2 [Planctomycetes bacterium]|nr:penicillin-binding protein 2 [Planctomycetota bacterium]